MDQSSDPRIGSGRNGSSGGTLSHATSSGSDSASLSTLGSTFIPVLVYAGVCLVLFFVLRPRCPRVYAPRTISSSLLPEERTPSLPSGYFNWIKPFLTTPDTFLLHHSSLDGFFFLRYVKILAIICLVGCCVVWPVLLPIHGTGGNGLTELDLLTIGNVGSKQKIYAHVFVSWIFFGFILYMISRESVYYINLRQAYLLSAKHSQRLSSRTVMFTCVPRNLLHEDRVRRLFGASVRNVWIPRDTKDLGKLVEEREQTAVRLEKAQIELIKMANAARAKQLLADPGRDPVTASATPSRRGTDDKGKLGDGARVSEKACASEPSSLDSRRGSDNKESEGENKESKTEKKDNDDADYIHPYGFSPTLPDVRGSVAAQWIPAESRPTHRPLANYGRRVDTIKWSGMRLAALNTQIAKLRRNLRAGHGRPVNALFVEFESQASAEAAFQILAHHRPLHMSPAFIGIRPDDVVWSTLRIEWWERIARRFLMMGLIAAAVIFWSVPAAGVGIVSKLNNLTDLVPPLRFLVTLPKPIVGVIQGLLPALALSLLMALVPVMLRFCAKVAGVPSVPLVEVYTQNAYFVFQVVQVFLITTITSAASTAITDVIKEPTSAPTILSQNLPKASNFYLSYILVQCLAGGAGELLRPFELIQQYILSNGIQHPRALFRVRRRLTQKHWGSIFPVFTNLGVIAISYCCIAPLILAFAGLGMAFTYLVYKYNLIYELESDVDAKGLLYPTALTQLITGLYLAEICMVGLFALQGGFIPMVLMVLFLVFTLLVHISISDAVGPLLYNLPRTLALKDKELDDEEPEEATKSLGSLSPPTGTATTQTGAADDYYNMDETFGDEENLANFGDAETGNGPDEQTDRAVEGASGLMSSVTDWAVAKTKMRMQAETGGGEDRLARVLAWFNYRITPAKDKNPNFLVKWMHPEIYEDYHILKHMFPAPAAGDDETGPPTVAAEFPAAAAAEAIAKRGYLPPEMWRPTPRLWIPRDDARVSRQEVAHARKFVSITDRGAWLDKKNKVAADLDQAPFMEPIVRF